MFARSIRCLGALLAVLVYVTPAWGQPATPTDFDLPAQSLEVSLKKIAERQNLQILYVRTDLSGIQAPALRGQFTALEAITKLTEGTSLVASFDGKETVVIKPRVQKGAGIAAAGPDIRLARAESGESSSSASSEEPPEALEDKGTPEILVKGSRSLNGDIRRSEDDPQPYIVFEREEILRSQSVNVGEFLKSRLPMNTDFSNSTGGAGTRSRINLRGLGDNQTLILIDGRRMPGGSSIGVPLQTDLNGISMAAIERIEVLPSTAGGIYGGSATGGVINIIMRRDFRAVEASANYINSFETDAAKTRLDVSAGFTLEEGRTRLMVSAAHSDANVLLVGDRDFNARAMALTLRNNPAAITGLATPPLGATVNIRSANGQPLVLDVALGGRALGFNNTYVPLGYAGPASDNGAALVANAGRYNTALPAGITGTDRSLRSAPATDSAALNVRREFGALEAFVDFASFGTKGVSAGASVPNSVTNLPATAPNNPFQQNIRVRFPVPNINFDNRAESSFMRGTAGLIARLPGNWMVEGDYGWSRSRFETSGAPFVIETAGTTALGNGLPGSNGRPALNALQEGNTFPIDFGPYLLPLPNQFSGPFDTVHTDAIVRLSGPTINLPGGRMILSALLERRTEKMEDGVEENMSSINRAITYTFFPHRSQDADSAYLEARVPLVSSRNAMPLVRELELQASVRHDRYNTRSTPNFNDILIPSRDAAPPALDYTSAKLTSTDYTVALRYAPLEAVTLRASFGTGFLPPSVTQIATREYFDEFVLGIVDSRRGFGDTGDAGPFTYRIDGSPTLRPELSESWSAGLILTPSFAPDLRLSADYTHIEKTDEIQIPNLQFLIDNEDTFPDRIQRGPNLITDEPDWAGPITLFDATAINIARTELDAADFQANYRLQTQARGNFEWYAVATWSTHFKNQLLPGDPLVDKIGFIDGPLEWRGNLGLNWERGALTLGWNAQYYNSYRVTYANPAQAPLNPAQILNQGARNIPSQTYHDLIATYRLERFGTELSFGIQNVLDKSPPLVASTNTISPGYSPYGDPLLRRYSLTVRKSFE